MICWELSQESLCTVVWGSGECLWKCGLFIVCTVGGTFGVKVKD